MEAREVGEEVRGVMGTMGMAVRAGEGDEGDGEAIDSGKKDQERSRKMVGAKTKWRAMKGRTLSCVRGTRK